MKNRGASQHNIDGAFVLVVFAVFAITVIAVLALGANSYRNLVSRDNDAYNRRILTSYVTTKIRSADGYEGVAVGGFADPAQDDGVNTLHLYLDIDGDTYDQRVYFYEGKVYELLTGLGSNIPPEDGVEMLDAEDLSFEMSDGLIMVSATDTDHRENHTAIAVRSLLNSQKADGDIGDGDGGVG